MAARVLQTARLARRGLLLRAAPCIEQAISGVEQHSSRGSGSPAGEDCCVSLREVHKKC